MNAVVTLPTEVRLADENDEMSLYVLCKGFGMRMATTHCHGRR